MKSESEIEFEIFLAVVKGWSSTDEGLDCLIGKFRVACAAYKNEVPTPTPHRVSF